VLCCEFKIFRPNSDQISLHFENFTHFKKRNSIYTLTLFPSKSLLIKFQSENELNNLERTLYTAGIRTLFFLCREIETILGQVLEKKSAKSKRVETKKFGFFVKKKLFFFHFKENKIYFRF
jgi:hypothetical protein